jgi:hypothetical protein
LGFRQGRTEVRGMQENNQRSLLGLRAPAMSVLSQMLQSIPSFFLAIAAESLCDPGR